MLFPAVILSTAGCGSDGPELCTVVGIVTMDGQPVPNAFVVFTPQGPGRPSEMKTDAEGRFELQYTEDRAGALVGKHDVTVSTEDIPDEGPAVKETIPAKYNRAGAIEVTVTDGANDIKLELESGGEIADDGFDEVDDGLGDE
ncbi:MAG TPA: carboxypeptidase regulatory-like domain-containing protein [Fuerstia sp.]|nr:carboxypeptidase regulatory-like domain-containing protein [Fuerstiella sp.]